MPIHHANVACDNCGQRHARDHQGECVEQLVGIVADLQASNARRFKVLARLRERFEEHQTALKTSMTALKVIAGYDEPTMGTKERIPGICPYGCDTPDIAQRALIAARREMRGAADES